MQKELKWLEDSIIYEIYPQSFMDSNKDGIGDIPGIKEKLDYIRELGCNVIWINACCESQFRDGGYDVTDYYKLAKRYGTNEEMGELIRAAHEKDIRILLDFVPGHTSDEHPWFQEFADESEAFRNRYIWIPQNYDAHKEKEHVVPLLGKRKGHYIANFYDFQPALNYGYANPDPKKPWQLSTEDPKVQCTIKEMIDVMKFWLDMGADGLRVDMAASLVKNDDDSSKVSKIWRKIRKIMDEEYPHAALLSEWSDPKQAIGAGFHMDFMIHVNNNAYNSLFRNEHGRNINPGEPGAYSFFDKEGRGDICEFLDIYMEHYKATRTLGHICIPSGNHDIPRLCFGRSGEELKVCFTFLLTMPGVPVIYYGDEIGMSHQTGLPDKEGGKLGPEEYTNRTGARTPMHWNREKNAGFSEGETEKLYLPVSEEYLTVNVEEEQKDEASLLEYVKQLIAFRHTETALQGVGEFLPVYAEAGKYPFIFERKHENRRFWIVLNPSGRMEEVVIPENQCSGHCILGKGITMTEDNGAIKIVCGPASYGIILKEE